MTARARLLAPSGELAGRVFEVAGEATIGRAADNAIELADSRVSGRHARLAFDPAEGCWLLEDLGSRNGTYLDGMRVREAEKLGALEAINVAGAFDFIFQVPAGGEAGVLAGAGTMIERAEELVAPPALGEPAAGRTFIAREEEILPAGLREPGEGTFLEREAAILPAGLGAPETPAPPAEIAHSADPAEVAISAGHTLYEDASEFVLPAVAARDEDTDRIDPVAPPPEPIELPPPEPSKPPLEPPPPELPEPPPAVAAVPAPPAVAGYTLVVDRPDGAVDRIELAPGEHLVGRGKGCEIAIDNPTLSRKHARLIVLKGRVRLVDLGSTNRTFVDDREVPPRTEIELPPGTALRFGAVAARLVRKDTES